MNLAVPPHLPVAIVGGGQAGLSLSHVLKQRGLDHIIFEKHTAMHVWRDSRWDSFTLVTPTEANAGPYVASPGPVLRGLPGPHIVIRSPNVNVADKPTIHVPLKLDVEFTPTDGTEVDMSSLKVIYLKLWGIDITDRIRPYLTKDGIYAENADLPPGGTRIRAFAFRHHSKIRHELQGVMRHHGPAVIDFMLRGLIVRIVDGRQLIKLGHGGVDGL